MTEHTVRLFDAELHELARKIIEMGKLAVDQIEMAAAALVGKDVEVARRVILADDKVDGMQREIEERAVSLIARRQPMADDLREIVGAMRITNDLERIGDLAENVAKRVLLIPETGTLSEPMLQTKRMADLVAQQVRAVLKSYENHDVAAALEVWRKDREIDALNSSLFRELLTYMMEDARNVSLCAHLLFCAKNIERIGDHATNLAETVYYIAEGRPLAEERPKADLTSEPLLPLRP